MKPRYRRRKRREAERIKARRLTERDDAEAIEVRVWYDKYAMRTRDESNNNQGSQEWKF